MVWVSGRVATETIEVSDFCSQRMSKTPCGLRLSGKLTIAEKHRTMLFEDEASPLRDFSVKIRTRDMP